MKIVENMPRVIFILGMHRSGTSCLAGSLENAGLYLGDVVTYAPFNQKGSRESKEVMSLNEQVLRSNDGSWFEPPQNVFWNNDQREKRNSYIRKWQNNSICGLKDPRLLLTLNGWLEVLPRVEFVGSFRNPASVVESLRKRPNQLGCDRDLLNLWQNYNNRLLELWSESTFPLVNFDSPPEIYRNEIQSVIERLKLPDENQENEFFDNSLRQQKTPAIEVPDDVARTYERLVSCWESGSVL